MPFHPLQDSKSDHSQLADLGLLVIRLLTAATFAYYQLVHHLQLALAHLWDGSEWNLVSQFTERGFPLPSILAASAIGLFAANLLGFLLGFFTRFNSLLLALMTGFVLLSAISLSPTLNPQTLVLYLAVFAGFAFGGAGNASLDFLLAGRKARRRAV